jgi:hypothetical protein
MWITPASYSALRSIIVKKKYSVKKNVFLALAILGFIVPLYFIYRFMSISGVNFAVLMQQVFANNASTAFVADLTISIIVFWIYMFAEANRLQMKNAWLYFLASSLIGLSFALPLFLYFRERQLATK